MENLHREQRVASVGENSLLPLTPHHWPLASRYFRLRPPARVGAHLHRLGPESLRREFGLRWTALPLRPRTPLLAALRAGRALLPPVLRQRRGTGSASHAGTQSPLPHTPDTVGYILDHFPIVRRNDEEGLGEYRSKRVILEIYDAVQAAARDRTPYAGWI